MTSCKCHRNSFARPRNCSVIKNPTSQLVLDCSKDEVKVQIFTGCPMQLWRVEEASEGRVYLINVDTLKVLSVKGKIASCARLTTLEKSGELGQLWHVNHRGGTIMVSGNLALDIDKGQSCAGRDVIIYPKNDKPNQQFSLEYV